jgi:hypothetical protein
MKFRTPARLGALLGALLLSSTAAVTAQAQTNHMHLGPRISYNFDAEVIGLGAQFSVPMGDHLEFYPSADVFLVSAGSFADLNLDLKLRVARDSFNWLYLGGGLNVARRSAGSFEDTRAGLNLFLGAESLRGRVHPFGELRLVASNNTTVRAAFGLNITLHSH